MTQIDSDGLLLGLFPDGGYTERKIQLNTKDELFIFTDGLIDFEENGEKKSDYNLFKDKLCDMLNAKQSFKQIRQTLIQHSSPMLVDDCSIINIHKQ